MKDIKLILTLLLLFCCGTKHSTEIRETHVTSLINYLQGHEMDSTIFSQPFFNDRFRSKKNPYNMYFMGLTEMQKMLKNSKSYKIDVVDKDMIRDDNHYVFKLSIESVSKADSIYLLVRDDGIESFSAIIKGGKIASWF